MSLKDFYEVYEEYIYENFTPEEIENEKCPHFYDWAVDYEVHLK